MREIPQWIRDKEKEYAGLEKTHHKEIKKWGITYTPLALWDLTELKREIKE